MEFPIRTGCFLPRHILREIQRDAHERGILTSDLLTKILEDNYEPLGKWAIPTAPRCHLKRHAAGRNYRNDWCENGGKCNECLLAKSYIEEGFDIKTSGWIATRNLENIQE